MTSATVTNANTRVQTDPAVKASLAAKRAARERERARRRKFERSRAIKLFLYRLLCWLELLPRRIAEATTTVFACFIVLMLFAAVFFAALGVLELALRFWASCIPG